MFDVLLNYKATIFISHVMPCWHLPKLIYIDKPE